MAATFVPMKNLNRIGDEELKIKARKILEEVNIKRENTIKFADYCELIWEASNLIFYSDIMKYDEKNYQKVFSEISKSGRFKN